MYSAITTLTRGYQPQFYTDSKRFYTLFTFDSLQENFGIYPFFDYPQDAKPNKLYHNTHKTHNEPRNNP